jgi:hypothetical protein
VWGLIVEGVFAPGTGWQNGNLPWLRITEYGRQCLAAGEITPHDPDGYTERLKSSCPDIDDTTLLYVSEALGTFRGGSFLATAVMVGVASEHIMLRLVERVKESISTTQNQLDFEKKTRGRWIKQKQEEVVKALSRVNLPTNLANVLEEHFDGIYNLIRRSRNESGHPTGKRLDRSDAHALLLMFPSYCKTGHELIDWLSKNRI